MENASENGGQDKSFFFKKISFTSNSHKTFKSLYSVGN